MATKKTEKNSEATKNSVKESVNMKEDIIMAAADEYEGIDLGEDEAPASVFLEEGQQPMPKGKGLSRRA